MSNKRWLCVPIASLALLGCVTTQEQLATGKCTSSPCKVQVKITDCKVETIPETLEVGGLRQPKNLNWDIETSGYVFAANGIVITNPGDQFEHRELSTDGKRFKWRDKHTEARKYKYAVNVVKTGVNQPCPSYDPWISNE